MRISSINKAGVLLFMCIQQSFAQSTFLQEELKKHPFIKPASSEIKNEQALDSFFLKLENLELKENHKASIVHIGDSHIQAGYFSTPSREELSKQFGNAGRGFIFPYRLAKSNGPSDYVSFSNVQWLYERNALPVNSLPVGLAGFTLRNMDSMTSISFRLKPDSSVFYNNNYLSIYHQTSPNCFGTFSITDSVGNVIAHLVDTIRLPHSALSRYKFDAIPSQFTIINTKKDSLSPNQFYGFSLESDSAGIIYHTIGVNGAKFDSYINSVYFMEELATLHPDLIIVSLGTNEAFDNNLSMDDFTKNVDSFIQSLRSTNENACILITIPGESLVPKKARKKRTTFVKNVQVETFDNALREYCDTHGLPYWDLYKVMGGKDSMTKWFKSKMADKRRVHFTKEGYFITGELFYLALIKSYNHFKETYNRSK